MTVPEYRALPHESYSSLKWLLKSPLHFKAYKEHPPEVTPAMRAGTAVDEAVLSGIRKPIAVMPADIAALEGKGSRTAKSAWKREQEAAGAQVYTAEEAEQQTRMIRALDESADFQALLRIMPERQKAIVFEYRGVTLKCLLDMAGHDANGHRCFGDLKTALDASPRGFGRIAYNRDYDLQCCLYGLALGQSEGLELFPNPSWAVVESGPAPVVSLFAVPPEALESGQRKLDLCIDRFLRIMETGEYTGYGTGWQLPEWPRYATSNLPSDADES